LLCKCTLRRGKFEIRREIVARDQIFFSKIRDRDVRDKEINQLTESEYTNVQGTELFVRDRDKFEIEGSRDRESPL